MTMQKIGVIIMAVVTLLSGATLLFENARPAYAQSQTGSFAVSSASTGPVSNTWIVDPIKRLVILCIQSSPHDSKFSCTSARLPDDSPAFKPVN